MNTGAENLFGKECRAALLESGATVILMDISEETLSSTRITPDRLFDTGVVLAKVVEVARPSATEGVDDGLGLANLRV